MHTHTVSVDSAPREAYGLNKRVYEKPEEKPVLGSSHAVLSSSVSSVVHSPCSLCTLHLNAPSPPSPILRCVGPWRGPVASSSPYLSRQLCISSNSAHLYQHHEQSPKSQARLSGEVKKNETKADPAPKERASKHFSLRAQKSRKKAPCIPCGGNKKRLKKIYNNIKQCTWKVIG